MKRFLTSFITVLFCLLTACSQQSVETESTAMPHWELIPTPAHTPVTAPNDETDETAPDMTTPLFDLTCAQFIAHYNAVYKREYGFTPLRPLDDWDELTPQGDLRLWRFVSEPNLSAEPALLLWAENADAPIERLCLDFSDHGYADENRERYEKLCLCTLESAGLTSDEAKTLFDMLFALAMDEAYTSGNYDAPDIKTLYHNGTIGLFPWYSEGLAHMDMIPVTPEKLDSLAQSGTEVIDFRAAGD